MSLHVSCSTTIIQYTGHARSTSITQNISDLSNIIDKFKVKKRGENKIRM